MGRKFSKKTCHFWWSIYRCYVQKNSALMFIYNRAATLKTCKNKKSTKANGPILFLTYVLACCFVVVVLFLSFFLGGGMIGHCLRTMSFVFDIVSYCFFLSLRGETFYGGQKSFWEGTSLKKKVRIIQINQKYDYLPQALCQTSQIGTRLKCRPFFMGANSQDTVFLRWTPQALITFRY